MQGEALWQNMHPPGRERVDDRDHQRHQKKHGNDGFPYRFGECMLVHVTGFLSQNAA